MPLRTNGAEIKRRRELRAWTQAEFGKRIGYAPNSISRIEIGAENGGPKFIRAAARAFGCTIADITTDAIVDGRTARRSDTAVAS